MLGPLGRRPPSDWTHVDKYPLMASQVPAKPTPVVIGVNWYVEFDEPRKDAEGHYPHLTRMPAKVLERLWKEDGEVGLVTDR